MQVSDFLIPANFRHGIYFPTYNSTVFYNSWNNLIIKMRNLEMYNSIFTTTGFNEQSKRKNMDTKMSLNREFFFL